MFDFSALDAELEGLGRAPENASTLARTYAGIPLSGPLSEQLELVDAELSALSNGTYQAPVLAARSGVMPVEAGRERAEPQPVAPLMPAVELREIVEPEPEPEPVLPLIPSVAFERGESAEPPPPAELHDDALSPLAGERSGAFANPAQARSPSLTESQEIVLPDPIAREELSSESGELSLDGADPGSGSFALPDTPTDPRIASDELAARAPVTTEQLLPFDDVQDALEGSQPIALGPRPTHTPSTELDRDPDAEFDALLSEATDPRGIPTHGGSGEIDTDDLLRGLEGDDELEPEAVTQSDPSEPELLTRGAYENGEDNTDVLDRATLGELELERAVRQESSQPDAAPETEDTDADLGALLGADEIDSGELEIIDDEPSLEPEATPMKPSSLASMPVPPASASGRPGLSNKAPPPPPPSSNPEKRPSLLGRLFTKRDGE